MWVMKRFFVSVQHENANKGSILIKFLQKLLILAGGNTYYLSKIWRMIMDIVHKLRIPWAIFRMTFLMALLLAVASGSQEPCDEANGSCQEVWSLGEDIDDVSAPAWEGISFDIAVDQGETGPARVSFDYLNPNQSSEAPTQKVIAVNDTAKEIEIAANDVDNIRLNYTIISLPGHGSVTASGPLITYLPEQGYVGSDSMVMGVYNETGFLQNVTIAIDVLSVYHPPSVRIRSPMSGEIFTAYPGETEALVPIRATSTGAVTGIVFYDGLTPLENGDIQPCENGAANCAVTYVASLGIGPHYLTARATDSLGKSCVSTQVAIMVNPAEPQVEITSPLAGQIFSTPAEITISADVTDSRRVKSVEFFANGKSLGEALESQSPYSFDWSDIAPGVYKLVAKATDRDGSAYSEPVMIVVVPPKPLSKSNLAITMSASPSPAPAGGLLNYVITVTNRGPDSASGVFVEDDLPAELKFVSQVASSGKFNKATGLWNVGNMAKYSSANLVITVRAPVQPLAGQIYNTAYVYGSQTDPDNSNNHATTYIKIKSKGAGQEGTNSTQAVA